MIRKLKIAIYSGTIPSTTFIEELILNLSKNNEVILFGKKKKPISYLSKNIKIYSIPRNNIFKIIYLLNLIICQFFKNSKVLKIIFNETRKYRNTYTRVQWFFKLLQIVYYKPDIFHLQWAKSLEHFMILKECFNIPIVLSLRGAHINYSPITIPSLANKYKLNFPDVDAFHAVSKAIAVEAEKYNARPEKTDVIYSIVPSNFFEAFKQTMKFPDSKTLNIISVGRPHWKKGYNYAISAIKILVNKNFRINYDIIGFDEPNEELLYLINNAKLNDSINLCPSVPQNNLPNLFHNYDLLLLSSVEEGIANVVIEAMAAGLPVITTNCGGMGEIVLNKKTGLIAPTRSSESIANAITEYLTLTPREITDMRFNAHEIVKRKFSLKNIDKFEKLYHQIAPTKTN